MEVGLAAGAIQFTDAGVRTLTATVRLLKRLKETPKRMTELLLDVDKSIERIHALEGSIQQRHLGFTHLSSLQNRRLWRTVDDANQAITELQHTLEPLFRTSNSPRHGWAKATWRSVVSVSMESKIAERIARISWLNGEVFSEMQLAGLNSQARYEYAKIFRKLQVRC